jgi:hypothetical protein
MTDGAPTLAAPNDPPPPGRGTSGLRDPWVLPGLALLAVLTVASVLLYRTHPQSVAEVRSSALVTLAPDAFTPHVARARERVDAAQRAASTGDTAGAVARYAEGEEEALTARQHAADTTQTRTATELWASIALDRAALMFATGAKPWYQVDNDAVLNEALAAVVRVEDGPVLPATKQRAQALDAQIRRQLRPGPLQWLPQ